MTPTQIECIERSKQFHARIAQRARPDTPIEAPKAKVKHLLAEPSAPLPVPQPAITEEASVDWVERQKQIHGWFWMVNDNALPKVEFIQKVVCRHFNMVLKDMNSRRRTADVVYPRQIAMALCKEFTKRSLPEIGRHFGGRDHTTVLHSVRVIGEREATDETLAAEMKTLREQIRQEHS